MFSRNFILRWMVAVTLSVVTTPAVSATHQFINSMRSTTNTYVFVSQSVEGEFGYHLLGQEGQPSRKEVWQGYGFRTAFGLELLKFVQFSVAHTFANMRSKADRLENLHGSRLEGEVRTVFSSPIGNLEAGGGVVGSRLDYQRQLENASFYGSGYYYTLGWNYFITSKVSLFGNAKMRRERLVQNGGSSEIKDILTDTTSLGFGFSLWL